MRQRGIYTVTEAPDEEPVSVAEAKAHMKVEHSDDDALIADMLTGVRQTVEDYLNRKLVSQTVELTLDRFEHQIELLITPVIEINSIKYLDDDESLQTVDSSTYQADLKSRVCRIQPKPDYSWPETGDGLLNAVRVNYTAGWADADSVPAAIKMAIKRRLSNLYENRQDYVIGRGLDVTTLDLTTTLLLYRYRNFVF